MTDKPDPEREGPDAPGFVWSGHDWYARDSASRPGGPGTGGNWSRANVVPDGDGGLTLRITNPTGRDPMAAELVSRESFGYGTYALVAEGDFARLPPAYVFGVFTFDWSSEAVPGFNEIDVGEVSSWGRSTRPSVSHAYHPGGGRVRDVGRTPWPSDVTRATFELTWRPRALRFRVTAGGDASGRTVSDHAVAARDVPVPRQEAFHVNLWDGTWDGRPADGQTSGPARVRLLGFRHHR